MGLTDAQIRGRIKNLAEQNNADPRVLMRLYMMERYLERVSVSKYRNNFIVKGGVLVTSLLGISMRSTMDIDTTIQNYDLSLENTKKMIKDISRIDIDDGADFTLVDVR
ncbi:nucleotidyl transferase AbiEii/AbiGii toxin family protein [Gardnerella vaginalis]|uniref:nucleotidyl transferase AbiEii/AbiGii toxin family protein n=1 Tax=Gardnerella vaginalis TaxID=2702 RepID=UPI0039EEAAFD